MASTVDPAIWEKQQIFLQKEQTLHPELFKVERKPSEELRKRIGIMVNLGKLPNGIIRYSPLDFIVEEIRLDGSIVTIDNSDPKPAPLQGEGTVYVDLVKTGLPTLDATQRLADALNLDVKNVQHAGIKDAVAVTGQKISFRNTNIETVKKLSLPNILLNNVVGGKGVVEVGGLKGNRFTLFIRTESEIDEPWLKDRITSIEKNGVMNYFGGQRFGTPRYLSHTFGLHLLRGDYEEMVRAYLSEASPYEWPLVQKIRKNTGELFGDWKAIDKLMENIPHTLRFEREILRVLQNETGANRYEKAILSIGRQANMWVRAYGSFLVNQLLSQAELGQRELPDEIPLLMNESAEAQTLYAKALENHGIADMKKSLRPFSQFVRAGRNPTMPTKSMPEFHSYKITPEGLAVSFSLPKGAYATTVLMYLFEPAPSIPKPEWLKETVHDTKKLLGNGTIAPILEAFKNDFTRMRKAQEKREETLG